MAQTLQSQLSWLSRQGIQLEETTSQWLEFLNDSNVSNSKEASLLTKKGIKELDLRRIALENALKSFTQAADAMNLTEENQQKTQENVSAAQEIIYRAQDVSIRLNLQLDIFKAPESVDSDDKKPQLPPIQIPKFKGLIWEWDQFWGIFENIVHNRQISNIEKLNYLLDALQGQAREAVQDLQITAENYDLAVSILKNRFGNDNAIVGRLLRTLQNIQPQSSQITEQRKALDKIVSIINQLEQKGECIDTQQMQRSILGKFSEKIQRSILKKRCSADTEAWTTTKLLQELQIYFQTEDQIQHVKGLTDTTRKEVPRSTISRKHSVTSRSETKHFRCFYCHEENHAPLACTKFSSYAQRLEQIRIQKLCKNCGSSDHDAMACTRGACRKCNKKGHHTSLCWQSSPVEQGLSQQQSCKKAKPRDTSKVKKKPSMTQNLTTVAANQRSTECFLGKHTVMQGKSLECNNTGDGDVLVGKARVWNEKSEVFEDVYIILDTGASRSFITAEYANKLGLKNAGSIQLTIQTFGNSAPREKICSTTSIEIEDRKGNRHCFNVALVDFIAGELQRTRLDENDQKYLEQHNIALSISSREQVVVPHILLGCADLFALFDNGIGCSHNLPSGLRAVQSKLGFLITGKNRSVEQQLTTRINTVNGTSVNDHADEQAKWDKFWSLDSAGIEEFTGPMTEEMQEDDRKVWEQFHATVQRHEDGYHVRLPWKGTTEDLPDNRTIAFNRLKSVLNQLRNQPHLLEQYHNTFKDQLDKGVIEEVDDKAKPEGQIIHYLAHQAVVTPHKDTTKLRVVFDGSAHHKNAPCLNDKLYQGPVILPSLVDMLNRFRTGKIAIISDIEKAFLQVRLQTVDRDATRCLWIRDLEKPLTKSNIVTYRFTRVIFGLNCSPFLLGATILEHASKAEDKDIADQIKDNIYVDNLVLTADNHQQAVDRCLRARKFFADINMNLREFQTNSDEANKKLPEDCLGKSTNPKILGIMWSTETDRLHITYRYPQKDSATKRTVSEQVAAVYDPLGWLTPLSLKAKLFLQELWKHSYKWDQELSDDHKQQWNTIVQGANGYALELPRRVGDGCSSAELVAFTDASKNAMATCVYIVQNQSSMILMAKSKLPSLKDNPTIPKLEMNALTMGMRLAQSTYNAIKDRVHIKNITIFTDSEIALSWLKNPSLEAKVGTLVRNRAKEIRKITKHLQQCSIEVRFGYINTAINPADCGTRGLSKEEFTKSHIWWTGPKFLIQGKQNWPECFELSMEQNEKTSCLTVSATKEESEELVDWSRHSSMRKAVSSFAYAIRWLERITKRLSPELQTRVLLNVPQLRQHCIDEFITVPEFEAARNLLLLNHQLTHIEGKINSKKDRLIPIKDSIGLTRCRGRLQYADLMETSKYPILIAPRTSLASTIIKDAHGHLHLGTAHTMVKVRETYWIPQLRRQVQKVLRRCVPCQKMNNLPYRYPEMPDLPERRVTRSKPFQHVGIDYFGPIRVLGASGDTAKAYGIIITCTVTRLLHLECVSDMSTENLLHSLRRFFARRGIPETITSDNAPYFLLGDQILRDTASQVINDQTIAKTMASEGIIWKTITPYAPWQGAFYERLIKSVKLSLYKVIGRTVPSMEVLTTLLIEIEGSLNTRPLTYQEEHWEEQATIRPIDFIQRDLIITYPMEGINDISDDPDYQTSAEVAQLQTRRQAEEALRSSHQLTEEFWKVWSKQYLTALREHHTRNLHHNHGTPNTPTIGTIVLIMDPNLPRNTWKMGRIIKVNQNEEGIVRDVELRLANRRPIRRPVNMLVPLELDEENTYSAKDPPENQRSHSPEEPTAAELNDEDGNRRYNLRRQERVPYNLLHHGSLLLTICLFGIVNIAQAAMSTHARIVMRHSSGSMYCTPEGVQVVTRNITSYELCSEGYCVLRDSPPDEELVQLPPEMTIHAYAVHWKTSSGDEIQAAQITCPAIPFCHQVNCWFCTANILNPECHPRMAILIISLIIYGIVALLYMLCYVPVVIGKPIRILFNIIRKMITLGGTLLMAIIRRRGKRGVPNPWHDRRVQGTRFVPIVLVMWTIILTQACQDVDVFELKTTACKQPTYGNESCRIDTTQMVKMNTFHREACFRISKDGVLIKEVRLEWKQLQLMCDKESVMFTRHTNQRVVDSKRCPRTGSCKGQKCADIHTTSIIPELELGNRYPGVTHCVESCGGPGCGCFYLSSGCLFYRIYAKPANDDIYELFRCPRWREEVVLSIIVMEPNQIVTKEVVLHPAKPFRKGSMKITLSSITEPPLPALQALFITNGDSIAKWTDPALPTLRCDSLEDAANLNCTLITNCRCNPAEDTMNCICEDINITQNFNTDLKNRLPVQYPWVEFEAKRTDIYGNTVNAIVPTLTTAELLVTIKEDFDSTIKSVTDSICTVEGSTINGCYNCAYGAITEVKCVSKGVSTMASIHCGDNAFTVPCSQNGSTSLLRFSLNKARVLLNCETSCGTTKTYFEISGILYWTKTLHYTAEKLLAGDTNIYDEWNLPDVGHIVDVFSSWYKFVIITMAVLLCCIAIGYLSIWTFGPKCMIIALKVSRIVTRCALRVMFMPIGLILSVRRKRSKEQ